MPTNHPVTPSSNPITRQTINRLIDASCHRIVQSSSHRSTQPIGHPNNQPRMHSIIIIIRIVQSLKQSIAQVYCNPRRPIIDSYHHPKNNITHDSNHPCQPIILSPHHPIQSPDTPSIDLLMRRITKSPNPRPIVTSNHPIFQASN